MPLGMPIRRKHPHALYTGITNWLDGNMFHSNTADAAELEAFT